MRIISGKFKGTKLFIPSNNETRPLKDLARESIFNVLRHSKKFRLVYYSLSGSGGLAAR